MSDTTIPLSGYSDSPMAVPSSGDRTKGVRVTFSGDDYDALLKALGEKTLKPGDTFKEVPVNLEVDSVHADKTERRVSMCITGVCECDMEDDDETMEEKDNLDADETKSSY